jgi:hypothetical protein
MAKGKVKTTYFDINDTRRYLDERILMASEVTYDVLTTHMQPIDLSSRADDVVMRQETFLDYDRLDYDNHAYMSIRIEVPYAIKRNYENDLNPRHKFYIERGQRLIDDLIEEIDLERAISYETTKPNKGGV